MTDRYALIGHPVAQSRSPELYAVFARQCGQDIEYHTILCEPNGFVEAVHEFQQQGGKGMNITMPFKRLAFELADQLTERARMAGAVNMFTLNEDGTILGDNTDGVGLVRDIKHRLGQNFEGQRVLLLGAGGAVRGALLPILAEHPAKVFITNRTASKAIELANLFASKAGETHLSGGGFSDIMGTEMRFDMIINGSASSMAHAVPPIPQTAWGARTLAYDMAYGKGPTAFMLAAYRAGVERAVDGIGMLVEQGAACFFLWRGVYPDTQAVILHS